MAFDVAAEAYDRFMGRYSGPLAEELLEVAAAAPGQRVLDVGCGPGALTERLAAIVGPDAVAGVDPSASFVAAARMRLPRADIRLASAEALPFDDASFDGVYAHLVVQFIPDQPAGLAEMRRVARPGARVAVTAWDQTGRGPLAAYWAAAHAADAHVVDELSMRGVREGELAGLLREAGFVDVEAIALEVPVHHATFEEWWEPYTLGVGPAGGHFRASDPATRDRIREEARSALGDGPITLPGRAWGAIGAAP
ncbi:class I SAM-dependent methyltransferase [Protaetiibacter intestinalis]|uniref:Methyltransferase domain-containing protein n=1 Tax=Protaetiibacter intestinalis TaxID=2419774 RepID=A0A387BDV7_9MICO|nr:methyltransferase domain-containing protein [Protaetiibacter intestinalis]AYF99079.1 methyltransferase domain-containing protein [Protaetiibacter intestinalis]